MKTRGKSLLLITVDIDSDFLLLMLPVITRLTWYLSGFSIVVILVSPFAFYTFLEDSARDRPQPCCLLGKYAPSLN